MVLKILHTSDLHLGMKCAGYGDVEEQLREARFETLGRLVALANEKVCDLLVVAGDLFNKVDMPKRDINRAATSLNDFQGALVLVLPGNHDYISRGQADLWADFKDVAGDNILLLEEERTYPLEQYGIDAVVYPAPCDKKHSAENKMGWIRDEEPDPGVAHHIGIAHGSLEGVSPDLDNSFYPMTKAALDECGLGLWLLGHTHIQYPENPGKADSIFFASTPEPDGFDCRHDGRVWIIELDDSNHIKPRSFSVGRFTFVSREIEIRGGKDLKKISAEYSSGEHAATLLKLVLKGRIPKDDFRALPEFWRQLESQVLYLRMDESELSEIITATDINSEFTEGSFPHTLLTSLSDDGDDEALQVAYELLQEQRR